MTIWTEERVAQLRKVAAREDKPTAAVIADELGVGRNAVIGACHRYGIALGRALTGGVVNKLQPKVKSAKQVKAAPYLATARVRHRTMLRKPLAVPQPEAHEAHAETLTGKVDLLDLSAGQCRFPSGDAPPFLFCGRPTDEGSSYCAAHHRMCWHKPERRRAEVAA